MPVLLCVLVSLAMSQQKSWSKSVDTWSDQYQDKIAKGKYELDYVDDEINEHEDLTDEEYELAVYRNKRAIDSSRSIGIINPNKSQQNFSHMLMTRTIF